MTLDALLTPGSIAVIGASRTPGKVGHDILANLIAGGFAGRIVPVNPSATTILDLPCFPSLEAAGGTIDLGVVAVPAAAVLQAVQDCLQAGTKAIVVITAGFRETGREGAELEAQVARLCAAQRVRLLGPNCLGLINTGHRMNASFAGSMPRAGSISIFSQSGALCTAILDHAAGRGFGLAKLVSIGNKADISEVDMLTALGDDPQTKVIVGYLESIATGDAFMEAAEEAASKKPVILMKAGTTQAGQRAASSHTGVLAGTEIAFGAAFRRSGIIRADVFEQILDFATALSMQPLPRGDRLLIITNAGGPGTMAADAAEKAGLRVASLGSNTAAALRGAPAAGREHRQPGRRARRRRPRALRGRARGGAGRPRRRRDPRAADPAGDDPRRRHRARDRRLPAPRQAGARGLHGRARGDARSRGTRRGRAARVPLARARRRARCARCTSTRMWRRRPPRIVTRFRVNRRRVERIISRRIRTGPLQLGEVKAKSILAAYGFRIPGGVLATSSDEAVEAAEHIGYPVVMKVVSPDIVHKSDIGGVRVGITTRREVRDAFDLMSLRIREHAPGGAD